MPEGEQLFFRTVEPVAAAGATDGTTAAGGGGVGSSGEGEGVAVETTVGTDGSIASASSSDAASASASASASGAKATLTGKLSQRGTEKDSVFDVIRLNLEELQHKVNILTRADQTVSEFNVQANTLNQRSLEIEKELNTAGAKYTCPPVPECVVGGAADAAATGADAGAGAGAGEAGSDSSSSSSGGSARDTVCPACPACHSATGDGTVCPVCADSDGSSSSSSNSGDFVPNPLVGDFVNLDMARELVADLVVRTCSSKLDALKAENVHNLQVLEGQMRDMYNGDTKAHALQDTERVVRLHNMRRDYALRRTGARYVHLCSLRLCVFVCECE